MDIPNLVSLYLQAHENAWSPNTLRSETCRLNALVKAQAITGEPSVLWAHLEKKGTGRYTRCTTWVRVSGFWNWGIQEGHINEPNLYKKFRSTNARLFKNAYERKPASITWKEANELVGQINDPQSQTLAGQLLHTGMRYEESFSLTNGKVDGKTGRREVYGRTERGPQFGLSYRTFLRHCAKVGTTPHELRKVFASHLVNKGLDEWALMRAMGWANIHTAQSYVATKTHAQLQDFIRKAIIK